MAIAHDAATVGSAYTSTGTQTTSHAAGTAARGACVLIDQNGTVNDEVSGVTYGGVAMTRLRFDTESTEAGGVYIYWLDGIATGTQNVAMTTTASTDKQLVVATMTVAAGQAVGVVGTGNTGTSAGATNPALTLTGLTNGVAYSAYQVIHSGLQAMTNTPANSFTLISSTDLGSQGRGFARRDFTASGTTQAAGWTAATSDDYVISGAAFTETAINVNGAAALALTSTGTAAEAVNASGASALALTFTGTAAEAVNASGASALALSATGASAGVKGIASDSSLGLTFTGTAAGTAEQGVIGGNATLTLTTAGSATSAVDAASGATLSLTAAGSAVGATNLTGDAALALTFTGLADGIAQDNDRDSGADLALSFTGTAEGAVATASDAALALGFTGTATPEDTAGPTPSGGGRNYYRLQSWDAPLVKRASDSRPLTATVALTATGQLGVNAPTGLTAAVQMTAAGTVGVRGRALLLLTAETGETHDRYFMQSENELRRLRDENELLLTL